MKTKMFLNKRKLLTINILLLIILLNLSVARAIVSALDISVTTSPDTLKPGDPGIFTVSIKNTHSSAIADGVSIYLRKGTTPIDVTRSDIYIGDIDSSDTESTVFPFTVLSSAEENMYSVRFEIVYSGTGDDDAETHIYRDIPVNITDPGKKIIFEVTEVTKSKEKLFPGDNVKFSFYIANYGKEDAENVRVSLVQDEQIFVTEDMGTSVYIGDFEAKALRNIPFDLMINPEITSGQYEFTLQINYADSQGTEQSAVSKSMGIEIQEDKYLVDVQLNKNSLNLGETTNLNFTITNNGDSPLQNLVFSWDEETGFILPIYSDNTKNVKYMGAGESVNLGFVVVADVNAQTGLYQLDLTLEFEAENGGSKELNTQAGIFIGGETDFDVTVSESSAEYTSLFVTNIGNNPALSVTVKLPTQEDFRITGSTSSIIGNLDVADYTIVSFQISQPSLGAITGASLEQTMPSIPSEGREEFRKRLSQANVSQKKDLKVLVEYTDTTGVRHSLEKNVLVQLQPSAAVTTEISERFKQRSGFNQIIYPIVALSILVVVGLVCYKKRKFIRASLGKILRKKKKS